MSPNCSAFNPINKANRRDGQIDTIKFLLIFFIFIFHLGASAGSLYSFVNIFQVPIFFLISGFWALDRIHKSPLQFLLDAWKKYLGYWVVWVGLYTAYYTIANSLSASKALDLFLRYFSGVRATGIYGMWFTPAFFFASLFYFLFAKGFSKLFKLQKRTLAWICCVFFFILFYLTRYFFIIPRTLIFSLGLVPECIFYLSLGAVIFPYLSEYKEKAGSCLFLKVLSCLVTLGSVGYFLLYFFKKQDLLWGWVPSLLGGKLSFLPSFITILVMFVFLGGVARLISCEFTAEIGRNTLGLCHCESLTKGIIISAGNLLGLNVRPSNPIGVFIFAFVALLVGCYLILPATDKMTKRLLSV